jgi:prepilin-type N-terminal cleavage/methylation domain-containing protein
MDALRGGASRPGAIGAFTLLELLVAMAILGILAAMTVPRWSALLPIFRLNSATRQIQSELHNLRAHAASENISFQLLYSENEPRYTTQRGNVSLVTRELPEGTMIARSGRISFSPRGTAQGGRVRIHSNGGSCTQVVVSPTGRIRICKASECNVEC